MKSPEEMMAYFKSMPKKERANPYWEFDDKMPQIVTANDKTPIGAEKIIDVLILARSYFRMVYESFGTEAQVLCVTKADAGKLRELGIPELAAGHPLTILGIPVVIFVPPQVNTRGNTILSETFWQKYLVDLGIVPVARIHSHYTLDAYQSITDYSTLNSNTLEIVMGRIKEESLHIAYWLDKHGTDIKAHVFSAKECGVSNTFETTYQKREETAP